jgi:hypothetical protein
LQDSEELQNILATFGYEGKLVEDGYLDAKKAGEALIGIDKVLRHFLAKEYSDLGSIEFEIPVRVQKGSWEALIPETLNQTLWEGVFAYLSAKYGGTALQKMADRDFENVGFKDILQASFEKMNSVIKTALHLGKIKDKEPPNYELSNDNTQIGIINWEGEKLWIPIEHFNLFKECPADLFEELAKVIEEERSLTIRYSLENDQANSVSINNQNKNIFLKKEEEEEILFPELEHNQYVSLEGHVTRGNEKANSIGFLYEDHVLTCSPIEGNIKDFKNALFSNCKLKGWVDRRDGEGNYTAKRPKIKFDSIMLSDIESKQLELFS